jgi:hypothetical protein
MSTTRLGTPACNVELVEPRPRPSVTHEVLPRHRLHVDPPLPEATATDATAALTDPTASRRSHHRSRTDSAACLTTIAIATSSTRASSSLSAPH